MPEARVPVTTAPNPRMAKARSIGIRKYCDASFSGTVDANFASSARNSSSPAPVVALTATIGASSRNEPRTNSPASSRASSNKTPSGRSALVRTTMPFRMPNNIQISKCSRVCGFMDSSEAKTKRTRSMPLTPASMFLMNLSWPGTSTKPRRTFSESWRCAKPRSMDMPRCFSSLRRSVSMPVSARTKAVLPWSIWPAVPIMMFFISTILMLAPLRAQDAAPINAKDAPPAVDQPEEATPTFKTGVWDVRGDVQVTEGDKLVKDLSKSDFAVTDEGQPQSIISFAHGDEPVTLILLLDVSGSMQKYIDQISTEAREALDHLRPGDRVALMVFAKNTAVAQGFSDNLAETARNIGRAVKNWDVGSSTMINSAVVDAAHYMDKHAGPGGRRAILILTDNLSTSYRLTDGQVIRELNKADTVMNAIITGRAIRPRPLDPAEPGKPSNPDLTPANVYDLTEKTGGEWVKAENAGDSFKDMIERIRSRYMLAYHAPDASPGTFRHIIVTLDDAARKRYPGAELHSRSGYYAE